MREGGGGGGGGHYWLGQVDLEVGGCRFFYVYRVVAADFSTCPGLAVSLERTKDRRRGADSTPQNPHTPFRKRKERRPSGKDTERPLALR